MLKHTKKLDKESMKNYKIIPPERGLPGHPANCFLHLFAGR
jgi:hypothetical protein